MIVIVAKQFIYKCRALQHQLQINRFIHEIDTIYKMEYGIAREKGKLSKHYDKWSKIFPNLIMLEEEKQAQEAYIASYISLL